MVWLLRRSEASRCVQLVFELVWRSSVAQCLTLTCQVLSVSWPCKVLSVFIKEAWGNCCLYGVFVYGACLLQCFSVLSGRGCCGFWGRSRSLWALRGYRVVCGPGCRRRLCPGAPAVSGQCMLVQSQVQLEGTISVLCCLLACLLACLLLLACFLALMSENSVVFE